MFSRKKTNGIQASQGERIFDALLNTIMLVMIIGAIYPIVYVLSVSLSSGLAVDRGEVFLLPVELTIEAYRYLFRDSAFILAFGNSMFYMVAGTAYNMFISVTAAYVMARKGFIFSRFTNMMVLITMWLGAGTIPSYMNYRNLGMTDSRLAIILGFGMSAYNIILIRNYFDNLPTEIIEAAKIDGASEWQVLTSIFIPLSKPIMATVTLFYALGRWNSWFWHSLLLRTDSKIPLQVVLRQLLAQTAENPDSTENEIIEIAKSAASFTTIQYAVMMFAIVPVIIVYPFVQRHFTKGIMLGGVKS